jgi:hypothetical protein
MLYSHIQIVKQTKKLLLKRPLLRLFPQSCSMKSVILRSGGKEKGFVENNLFEPILHGICLKTRKITGRNKAFLPYPGHSDMRMELAPLRFCKSGKPPAEMFLQFCRYGPAFLKGFEQNPGRSPQRKMSRASGYNRNRRIILSGFFHNIDNIRDNALFRISQEYQCKMKLLRFDPADMPGRGAEGFPGLP